jgi:hypothetical protein
MGLAMNEKQKEIINLLECLITRSDKINTNLSSIHIFLKWILIMLALPYLHKIVLLIKSIFI